MVSVVERTHCSADSVPDSRASQSQTRSEVPISTQVRSASPTASTALRYVHDRMSAQDPCTKSFLRAKMRSRLRVSCTCYVVPAHRSARGDRTSDAYRSRRGEQSDELRHAIRDGERLRRRWIFSDSD